MAKIITIISGKGGVGKTTSVINLAAALNDFGKDVIIIDANLTTPNIGVHLGAPVVATYLNHALIGKNPAKDALYFHKSGVKIMPASLSLNHLRGVKPERLFDIAREIEKLADYILIDSAAGLGREALSAIKAAEEIIIITQPEIAAVTDALKTIKISEKMGKKITGVILTRVRNADYEMTAEDIKMMLETRILGIIPEDKFVRKALKIREPVFNAYPRSKSALSYKAVAARILGDYYLKKINEKSGVLFRFFKSLGIN
jgi:septum site-determining protein MinD